jgi:hypothetical protein
MSKRSQVTVFIIVAVILVAVGGVALFTVKGNSKPNDDKFFSQANIKPDLNNIKTGILQCRDDSIKLSLDKIGIQGGYFDKPAKSLDIEWAFIPYYYSEGSYLMPARTKIQTELGKAVDKSFVDCINKLKFDSYAITHGTSKTTATINRNLVLFKIDMPLTIKKEDNTMVLEMSDAPAEKDSALFDILDVADYITNSHKNDSEMICVTCVANMAEERDLYVNTFDLVDNSILVVISENHTSSEPYSFEFLNKYVVNENTDVILSPVPGAPVAE